jgi:hypothetical protein
VREKLHNVTAEEAAAIVATSTLLTLSVFASTGFELNFPEIPSSQGPIEGILNIFSLMQGMGNVLALAQAHVMNSWLSPMFQDPQEAIASQPLLRELIHQIPTLISFIHSKSDLPSSEKNVYLQVIGHFEPALKMAMPPRIDNRELRFLFFWPLHLQSDFTNLVRQKCSGALAVLMYYSTMLFASQSRYWFMRGWGEKLMRACSEALAPDWHPCVEWAMSFITHNPTYSLFSNLVHLRQAPGIFSANQALDKPEAPHPKPVEVPYRHYPDPSLPSNEIRTTANTSQYQKPAEASSSLDDEKANTARYV